MSCGWELTLAGFITERELNMSWIVLHDFVVLKPLYGHELFCLDWGQCSHYAMHPGLCGCDILYHMLPNHRIHCSRRGSGTNEGSRAFFAGAVNEMCFIWAMHVAKWLTE